MQKIPAPKILCRQINQADITRIINFRARGSAPRQASWTRAFERLSAHPTPPGFPKYGYMLEHDGEIVGVLLLIYAFVPNGDKNNIRCSVSNWYVDPRYRSYGALLAACALKYPNVTYTNITSAPHTRPILETQGYSQYSSGVFVAAPALSAASCPCRIEVVTPEFRADADLSLSEIDLLLTHRMKYDAISLVCRSADGTYPFVFLPRRKWGLLPFVHLGFCQSIDSFVRFARPLGKVLFRLGFPLVILDAGGSIPGLIGKYSDTRPKYFKGPDKPRMGDLAYSELAVFNF